MGYRHDWTKIGADHTGTDSQKARILEAIADIDRGNEERHDFDKWIEIPRGGSLTLSMMAGMGIRSVIENYKLPGVTAVAVSTALSPCGMYGIRCHYKNPDGVGVSQINDNGEKKEVPLLVEVDVFVVDMGESIVVLLARVHL